MYITGISGTGKSTLVKEFRKLGKVVIEIDDYSRWHHKESGHQVHGILEFNKEFLNTHEWLTNIDELKETFDKTRDKDIFVFGLVGKLKENLNLFDKIILLTCSTETAFKRIDQRNDNDFGKNNDTKEWIKSWKDDFEKEWTDLGAIPVSVEDSIEVVTQNILKICN